MLELLTVVYSLVMLFVVIIAVMFLIFGLQMFATKHTAKKIAKEEEEYEKLQIHLMLKALNELD